MSQGTKMNRQTVSFALCAPLALSIPTAGIQAQNGPDGPIGTVSEPLVGGTLAIAANRVGFFWSKFYSVRNGSPEPYSTGSLIMSISWR